jgi:hypothetical protein
VLEGEPQGEYQALLDGLRKHFRPEGALEEGYVELLAAIRWRQRRYHIAEAAEIEAGRTFLEWEAVNTPVSRHLCVLTSKIENPEVLDTCVALLLQVVRKDIENAGSISKGIAPCWFASTAGLTERTGSLTFWLRTKLLPTPQLRLRTALAILRARLRNDARKSSWPWWMLRSRNLFSSKEIKKQSRPGD